MNMAEKNSATRKERAMRAVQCTAIPPPSALSVVRGCEHRVQHVRNNAWYTLSGEKVIEALHSSGQGLSSEEAAVRLAEFGKNELPSPKADGYVRMFVRQFASPLIYLLLGAGVVVFFLGEVADAVIIFLVLIFNAVVGVMQEGRAQRTLDALRVF